MSARGRFQRGGSLLRRQPGRVQLGHRNDVGRGELLRTCELRLNVVGDRLLLLMLGPQLSQARRRLREPRFVDGRIESGDDLSRPDGVVEVGVDRSNRSGDLRTDRNSSRRLQCAAHHDAAHDVAPGDLRGRHVTASPPRAS